MPTPKAPLIGAIVLAVLSVTSSARASQAWGAISASASSINLTPLQTVDGAYDLNMLSRSGESLALSPVIDLASDPVRYPSFVWAVRAGATNDIVVVDPHREELISQTLLDSSSVIRAIAINPVTGVLYGTASDALYTIEPFTGETKLVATMTISVTEGLGFDANGNLFGIHIGNFYGVNTSSGEATLISSSLMTNGISDLAMNPADGVMYALGPKVYHLGTVDLTTGVFTSLGRSLSRAGGLAFTAVPEPSCLAMLAVAGAAAFVNRRRINSV